MKISASLFSKKESLKAYANQLNYAGIDFIHIDYLANPNHTVSISSLVSEPTKIPYDVHLVVQKLDEKELKILNKTSIQFLAVEYENLEDKKDINKLKIFNGKIGIGFTMETPIEIIEEYIPFVNFILIMCTKPGISGACFNEENIDRIKYLRKNYPDLSIHVDGGIDNEKIVVMNELGVELCVSGSYLAATDGIELIKRVCKLKFLNENIKAKDIMIPVNFIKLLNYNSDFYSIISNINDSKLGLSFIEDNGNFVGIITDGDIRRALLKYKEKSFSLCVKELVNNTPFFIDKNDKIYEVIYKRMLLEKNISTIPVLDGKILVGVLDIRKIF